MKSLSLSLSLLLLRLLAAAPAVRAATPTVTIGFPQATIVGIGGSVEKFPGVPFAAPPVGQLRFRPPQPLTQPLGTIKAQSNGPACPQFFFSTDAALDGAIPTAVLGQLLNTPLFQTIVDAEEDCLYLNIHRPEGTKPGDKLPVLFWIFGGGFELGYNSMYDGAGWVANSVRQGKPIIMVTVNYRVGGFGFLPGKEIMAEGSANLGLLDQRLGLEWIADNIAAFGGDPAKVTIWGESAGAISVLDQMLLYDGDHNYKGKPLFRGGIMNSGSILPADPVDCPKSQVVYDTVVKNAGCAKAADTLACLRTVDYPKMLNAANSVPGILGYQSVALSYLPRPDGKVLTQSPELLVASGKYAKIPFIVGDQEDEGTIFALFQSNISTTAQLVDYFAKYYFKSATRAQIQELVNLYPNNLISGAPHRTGLFNNWYPQYKRLAAMLGDLSFTLSRRAFLDLVKNVSPDLPTWSYLASYNYGTPILGTFHASDILQTFFGVLPNYAAASTQSYYLSFVNTLDPNKGNNYPTWPKWAVSNQLMNTYPLGSTLIVDDFRSEAYEFIAANTGSFRI